MRQRSLHPPSGLTLSCVPAETMGDRSRHVCDTSVGRGGAEMLLEDISVKNISPHGAKVPSN